MCFGGNSGGGQPAPPENRAPYLQQDAYTAVTKDVKEAPPQEPNTAATPMKTSVPTVKSTGADYGNLTI